MKRFKIVITLLLITLSTSCVQQDLARNLRYSSSDGREVGVSNIEFESLRNMKYGRSCLYKVLGLPVFGNNSIISAVDSAKINNVRFVGETGFWGVPLSKSCIAVYGD